MLLSDVLIRDQESCGPFFIFFLICALHYFATSQVLLPILEKISPDLPLLKDYMFPLLPGFEDWKKSAQFKKLQPKSTVCFSSCCCWGCPCVPPPPIFISIFLEQHEAYEAEFDSQPPLSPIPPTQVWLFSLGFFF